MESSKASRTHRKLGRHAGGESAMERVRTVADFGTSTVLNASLPNARCVRLRVCQEVAKIPRSNGPACSFGGTPRGEDETVERAAPESLPKFPVAFNCPVRQEGTDLPGLCLHRLNTLLKGHDGVSVLGAVSGRTTDASTLGANPLARRRSSASSVQLANYDTRETGRRDDPEQVAPSRRRQFTKAARRKPALLHGHR